MPRYFHKKLLFAGNECSNLTQNGLEALKKLCFTSIENNPLIEGNNQAVIALRYRILM